MSPVVAGPSNATFTRAFPFSFTMGPVTIYPLFLLPLLFWISPIAAGEAAELLTRADLPVEERKITVNITGGDSLERKEPSKSFYPNRPLTLNQIPQKDRYYTPAPISYYPYMPFNSFFNYPTPNPYSGNPYYSSLNNYMPTHHYNPYSSQGYQSQMYDPYVYMMSLTAPNKYQGYGSPMVQQTPHPVYQPNFPYYSGQSSPKPFNPNDAQQIFSSLHQDPNAIITQYNPSSEYSLYSTLSPGGNEQMTFSSSTGASHGQIQTAPSNFQTAAFGSLSSDSQHLLNSLTSPNPPFGFIDKQARNPNEDPSDIARIPPPKAIMTTASDVLGLRGHATPSFQYTPEHEKYERKKNAGKPTFVFNDNTKQTYPDGLDLQLPKKYTLKTTTESVDSLECENCEEQTYESQPVISASVLNSPHGDVSDFIEQVLRKTKQDIAQPHNILPEEEEVVERHEYKSPPEEEPVHMFTTSLDEEDPAFYAQQDADELVKSQVYRCPMKRDLREMSQAEIFPDPIKCDQFYYCKNGRAYIFKCPVNQAFNPITSLCERDEDYACSISIDSIPQKL